MSDSHLLERITSRRDTFDGKPIVRGMRISVELILSLLAQGESAQSILDDYPDLEPEDIRACIAYALAVIAQDKQDLEEGAIVTVRGSRIRVSRTFRTGE